MKDKGTDNTMAKFKQRRTKGWTRQWPNLNEEGQRDGQNNDLQNTTQTTKDGATQTPLKTNNDLQNTTQTTTD